MAQTAGSKAAQASKACLAPRGGVRWGRQYPYAYQSGSLSKRASSDGGLVESMLDVQNTCPNAYPVPSCADNYKTYDAYPNSYLLLEVKQRIAIIRFRTMGRGVILNFSCSFLDSLRTAEKTPPPPTA